MRIKQVILIIICCAFVHVPLLGHASTLDVWYLRASGTTNSLYGITYGAGLFVAVGDNGVVVTSPDGVTWTARASGITYPLRGVAFGNSTYVAVGMSGNILTSPDGSSWTARNSSITDNLFGIVYGNGIFVAVGGKANPLTGGFSRTILTSPDGITWTIRLSDQTVSVVPAGIFYGNATFVTVGQGGTALYSTDGASWTPGNTGVTSDLKGITYGNGGFVTVGARILTSQAGAAWTDVTPNLTFSYLSGIAFNNGVFIAVGLNTTVLSYTRAKIFSSPDGLAWTERISGSLNPLLGVTGGNNTFVSVGSNGSILQALSATTTFSDIAAGYWAEQYINAIYNDSITVGCSHSPLLYCPSENVTRNQMAAFIIRALYGENFTYSQTPYFSDVPATDNFFKYIQKLKDLNITTLSGAYLPGEGVTRGQMAAFLVRARQVETGQPTESFTYTPTAYFTDVPAGSTFFSYVQRLKDIGITTVTGTYGVDEIVPRDQMAAFIARTFLGIP
jgi:hypothetical protein